METPDMTSTILTAELIAEAVASIDSWEGIRVYDGAYSGRGMYGAGCFAVTVDAASDMLALGAAIAMVIASNMVDHDIDASDAIDPLTVYCPACDSAPDHPCRNRVWGFPRSRPHPERIVDAAALKDA